jgi:hypothetical protein
MQDGASAFRLLGVLKAEESAVLDLCFPKPRLADASDVRLRLIGTTTPRGGDA